MLNILHDWCTRSHLYGFVLRKSVHGQLRDIHQDSWPSVAWNVRSLSAGLYQVCGATLTIAEVLKNLAEPKMDPPTVCLHTFDFIRDLHTLGDNNSRRLTRQCITHWIENNSQWSNKPWRSPSWNLDILGYRLCNWLGFYEFFAHSANQLFRKKLISSIGQQYRFLKRRYPSLKDPISRFRALKGLIYAGCALPGEQNQLGKWIENLHKCLQEQLDDNFNQQSRHPGTVVLLLRDLIDLRLLLRHFYAGQVDYLNDYIIHLAPIVRHLRHGDGALSSFTGNATQRLEAFCSPVLGDGLIDMALSLADSRVVLPEPVAMGYVRCSTKPGFILINTQPTTLNTTLHDWYVKSTGVLDFEWSERAQRLIARCDASVHAHDSNHFMHLEQKKKQTLKSEIIHEKGHAFFSGEYQINCSPNKNDLYGAVLQVKRDLYISPNGDIRGEEFFILSQLGQGSVRFLAAPELEWRIVQETESAFLCRKTSEEKPQKPEHLKKFLCQADAQLHIVDVLGFNALCVTFPLNANQQTSVKWALSPIS
jgi:hypothetical protein